jgi:Leucine-rich repeat (LRR) protein
MKKRLLSIIIALLALVSGAQAETGYPPVKIYDGYKPKSLFNQYLAMFQVVANVEGKLVLENTSSNVLTFKNLNGNTLFSIDTKAKTFSVPANVQPYGLTVRLSQKSKEALKKVDSDLGKYDAFSFDIEQTVSEKNFPDDNFRYYVILNICRTDVSGNPIARLSDVDINKVKSIDVNNYIISDLRGIGFFTNLEELSCANTGLTSLDLSKNTKLEFIDCSLNKISGSNMDAFISSLPTVTNRVLYVIRGTTDQNSMTCRQVGNARKKGWEPISVVNDTYSFYFGCDFVCNINSNNFPDDNFRNYISNTIDTDRNGMLDQSEIAATTQIDVSGKSIGSLTGISYFTELVTLACSNNNLTSLDLRSNTRLIDLFCDNNKLNSLTVLGLGNLQRVNCQNNNLGTLGLPNSPKLRFLCCSGNQLTSLTMQGRSSSVSAPVVYCDGNQLRNSGMTALVHSLPKASNNDGYLYVTKNEASTGNQITTAQVNTATEKGYDVKIWDSNKQAWVSHPDSHPGVYTITVYDGATLSALDLQILTEMMAFVQPLMIGSLSESDNVYTFFPLTNPLFGFQCNKNTRKCGIYPYGTNAGYVYGIFAGNFILPVSSYYYMYQFLNTILKDYPNVELRMEVAINSNTFPDTNFRTWVSNNCDTDKNGRLTKSELAQVTSMDVSNKNISNLKGIEYFWELTHLDCSGNNLTSLDLTWQASLTTLNCSGNKLQSLNISQCKALEYLYCNSNQLTSLSLSNNTALKNLRCQNNLLSSLSVSKNTELVRIMCYGNKIQDANMTSFINSLPKKSDGRLNVYANNSSEGNKISVAQVKVAKEDKGWQVLTSGENPYPGYDAIAINETNFPDYNFRSWLLQQSYGSDGYLTPDEIADVTEMNVSSQGISSLMGIRYFTALEGLSCNNNYLSELYLSGMYNLERLECYGNRIRGGDMTKLINSLRSQGGQMWAMSPDESAGDNLITVSQVNAANEKSWSVYEMVGNGAYDFAGARGDANGDLYIDEDDIATMRDYVTSLDPSSFSFDDADMNGDGTVDIVDLTLLIQYLTE